MQLSCKTIHIYCNHDGIIKQLSSVFHCTILSRLMVVSREAKKEQQQARALQDHAATTVSNLHAQQL